jgi:PKD repeat protein
MVNVKNKAHILILLAFLLVGGMIVSPVCAWTQQDTVTLSSATVNAYCLGQIGFHNYTVSKGITKLEYSGYCLLPTGSRTSGSWSGNLFSGATRYGNVSVTWTGTSFVNWSYYGPMSAKFEFSNMDQSLTGARNFNLLNYAGTQDLRTYIENGCGFTANALQNNDVHTGDFTGISHTDYSVAVSSESTTSHVLKGTHTVFTGSAVSIPVASFTCNPVSQFPDEDVICTDTSSNTPTDWLWTLDYEALGIQGWQTSTSRNFTWQSHYTGIFGVNLKANNSAGNSWYNRSNYVEISDNATPIGIDDPIPAGYIRSMVQCVNPEDSSLISDCAISIKDIEGNAWSNGSFHGTWFIDTLPLHHINAYGSASGYTSAYRLNLDASSSLMYELFLFPGYLPPAAAGHVRLYAIVNDYTTGAPVLNAQVEFKGSGESTQIKYTSVSGIAQVEWANVSTVYVSASKAGYSPASRTIVTTSTGPDTVRLELSAPWVTLPVTSGTPLPGEFTVRPTQDPNKNPDGSYVTGYSNIKGQEMMNWLAEYGFQLVQLCFFVTILGLLGVKLGGK